MFDSMLTTLRLALEDILDVKRKSLRDGLPLEELHRQILHLRECIKHVEEARDHFLRALGGGDLFDDE
jgi:hypothetical protein